MDMACPESGEFGVTERLPALAVLAREREQLWERFGITDKEEGAAGRKVL